MHTRPGKLQEFLVANPLIRQDVATEIDLRAAELREKSRGRQEYVVADHLTKLAKLQDESAHNLPMKNNDLPLYIELGQTEA